MKKVAVVTATRAEYGLLSPLMRLLTEDDFFDCHVIVSGTHLVEAYGHTVDAIRKDGIPVAYEIPIMEECTTQDHAEVIARALKQFDRLYRSEKYDGIILLGDRYELYGFAIPALLRNIPVIHIHGGEKTEGAVDEKIRHSITKMASIHFPSIRENADRIIQMGENPRYVYPVGALGIDNAIAVEPIPCAELSSELGIDLQKPTAIVTYHPVTTDTVEEMVRQVHVVMQALSESGLQAVVTMPNSDVGGDRLLAVILDYLQQAKDRMVFFKNLGQRRYLSTLRYAEIVYGNSSSGIIEAASFHVPVIDIGDRQKGRYSPKNVIHCACRKEAIREAIALGRSDAFRQGLKNYVNPYGDGHAAERMVDTLKRIDWEDEALIRKAFFDISMEGTG